LPIELSGVGRRSKPDPEERAERRQKREEEATQRQAEQPALFEF